MQQFDKFPAAHVPVFQQCGAQSGYCRGGERCSVERRLDIGAHVRLYVFGAVPAERTVSGTVEPSAVTAPTDMASRTSDGNEL